MPYVIALLFFALVSAIAFYVMNLIDVYLWGMALVFLVFSFMFGFWLNQPIIGIVVFLLSAVS